VPNGEPFPNGQSVEAALDFSLFQPALWAMIQRGWIPCDAWRVVRQMSPDERRAVLPGPPPEPRAEDTLTSWWRPRAL
jgi:hypothetical protein